MADAKRDANRVPTMICVRTADGKTIEICEIDHTTGRLLVDSAVSAIVPGTGATNLGKAEDAPHVSGDVGVMALGVKETDDFSATQAGTDGDYSSLSTDYGGWLRTKAQALFLVDACTATAGFTVLGNDTINLTTATPHLAGSASISFDKTDGAADTKIAGVQKTLGTTIDFFKVAGVLGQIQSMVYLSDVSDCDYFFVRLGTNSTNYNEWRISIGDAWTAGIWETIQMPISEPNYAGSTGDGWNPMAVDYLAFGVAFDAETDALAGILVDRILFAGGLLTTTDITASITSDINSANINLLKVGNKVVNKGEGVIGTGTQRITIATDDEVNNFLGNISDYTQGSETALEKIDGAIIGPGEPTIDSYTHLAINKTTGNDQVLVASSASKQIWVYGISFTCSVAGTVSFQDEDNTAITGIMDFYANSGLASPPSGNFAMPIWKLATNKDLEVDIVDCDVDGWLDYAIVSV